MIHNLCISLKINKSKYALIAPGLETSVAFLTIQVRNEFLTGRFRHLGFSTSKVSRNIGRKRSLFKQPLPTKTFKKFMLLYSFKGNLL